MKSFDLSYLVVDNERMALDHVPAIGEIIRDVQFLRNGKRSVRITNVEWRCDSTIPDAIGQKI